MEIKTGYLENRAAQLDIQPSCSVAGVTTITYTIGAYESYPLPTWVTWNTTANKVDISPPDVSSDQTFYFSVIASIPSVSVTIATPVSLQILNCAVSN